MDNWQYQDPFPLGKDNTVYKKITSDFVSTANFEGNTIVKVQSEGLKLLAKQAFRDVSHLLRTAHLEQLAHILDDAKASDNDKYVALEMLRNAAIAAEGVFPTCQDTGTSVVMGKKGQAVWTDGSDAAALSAGIREAYLEGNLRYSQNAPLTMFKEVNTGCNLPAQIDILSTPGDQYSFLFMAKGGGSANKTYLFQETKTVLNENAMLSFMLEKMVGLGTAACPPYHLAFVVGGTSVEANLKTVKLATAKYLDNLPTQGNESGQAFRDLELEEKLLKASQDLGIGAQFGGKYFCLDVRVIRLPRHGASCPIGIGVSCSADRNIKAKINADGIFLEQLEEHPERFLPEAMLSQAEAVHIDLNRPMDEIRAILTKYPVATRVMLSGDIVVARDIAHAKLKERLDSGEGLPDYFKDHIVYYAGPAKTPPGYACGSCGPTTSGRMDPYVPIFQKNGASMVMLGKGNRSTNVTESCRKYGGFYLGSIGGPAARLGKECITAIKTLEYPELGMEAISLITVKDFPAFIIVDDKGHDFFAALSGRYRVLRETMHLSDM
ncbi:MAG: fumarate hydratase [Desulfatibacillum sp.]|nr:fumarate hydratase [Desulfatibacillum sp.]